MSVIDAENVAVVGNIQPYASDDSDTHEFRPLTEEEKQNFVSFADTSARQFAEEKPDDATNSIEDNDISPSRELLFLPPTEQPLAPLMDSSPLEFRPNQVATRLHKQDQSVMLQFALPLLVSVIAFFLVLNYPLLHFSLPENNQQQTEQTSASNPLPVLAATPEPTSDMTAPALPAASVVPAVEAPPATQMPATIEPALQEPPKISAKSQPAARARAETPPTKKQNRQQRAAQLAEPAWLAGPAWSRDPGSFVKFLYFGRVN